MKFDFILEIHETYKLINSQIRSTHWSNTRHKLISSQNVDKMRHDISSHR